MISVVFCSFWRPILTSRSTLKKGYASSDAEGRFSYSFIHAIVEHTSSPFFLCREVGSSATKSVVPLGTSVKNTDPFSLLSFPASKYEDMAPFKRFENAAILHCQRLHTSHHALLSPSSRREKHLKCLWCSSGLTTTVGDITLSHDFVYTNVDRTFGSLCGKIQSWSATMTPSEIGKSVTLTTCY